jgi:hypothetical protein
LRLPQLNDARIACIAGPPRTVSAPRNICCFAIFEIDRGVQARTFRSAVSRQLFSSSPTARPLIATQWKSISHACRSTKEWRRLNETT